MDKTKHILFVLPTLHAGGAENYTLRFIKYCQSAFRFSVLSVATSRGDLHDQFVKEGVTVHYKSIGYFNPAKWVRFYRLLKANRYDAICTMNGNFGGVPLFLAKMAGIQKRIAFYRRSTIAFQPTKLKLAYNDFAKRLVKKHATDILSNSTFAFQNFFPEVHLSDKRFKVVPNGVNPDVVFAPDSREAYRQKFGIPADAFVVGHVGRYDPAKNHETIFAVGEKLLQENPKTVFLFCGKDTDSDKFASRLNQYGMRSHCVCLGLQEKIGEVLKTMDVFLFPSLTEGQPNSLIEAMIAGIPVIASNIQAIEQTVPDFITSTLVDPLDVNSILDRIRTNPISDQDLNRMQQYAIEYFDYRTRFDAFKFVISNYSSR